MRYIRLFLAHHRSRILVFPLLFPVGFEHIPRYFLSVVGPCESVFSSQFAIEKPGNRGVLANFSPANFRCFAFFFSLCFLCSLPLLLLVAPVHVCSSSSSSSSPSSSSSRSLARVAILFSRVRPLFLAVLENPPVLFPGLGNEVREAIAYERVTPLARIYSYA